jgi:hypothetical protein
MGKIKYFKIFLHINNCLGSRKISGPKMNTGIEKENARLYNEVSED